MNNHEIYIIGCGGNAKVVVDICELNGYQIGGFFDDKFNGEQQLIYRDHKVIGKIKDTYQNINVINSIGDGIIRQRIYEQLKDYHLNWINCIHPNAYISPTVKMGIGNIICYGALINSDTLLGNFNLVNTYAVIEHDCLIGNFNHFAPKTVLCGGVTVGDVNLFGAGTTVIPGKAIGNNNIIGAMSAIINCYDNGCTIVGVPGKIIKNKSYEKP